jgi:hypothetical protein
VSAWVCAILFVVCGSAQAGNPPEPSTSYRIAFDKTRYEVGAGETFEVQVLIAPPPPDGLFSFGIRVVLGRSASVVGAVGIRTAETLAHDGPRLNAPVVAVGESFAATKGTADFLDARRPNATNAILATFLVQDNGGEPYELGLNVFNTLGPTEQIFVDSKGQVLDSQIVFGSAHVVRRVPGGALEVFAASDPILNRQSGLFEQVVRVRNGGTAPIQGIRLLADGIPPGWAPWNAVGATNGVPFFDWPQPLAAGEAVDLRVEYRIVNRQPTVQPAYRVETLGEWTPPPDPPGDPFRVEPRATLADGSFLLEFDTLKDRSYSIQYSSDLTRWITVVPNIRGNGSRFQWIDNGPPKTATVPRLATNRYYRVFLVP